MSKLKNIPILILALAGMTLAQTAAQTPAKPATTTTVPAGKAAPAANAPAPAQTPAKPAQTSVGSGIKNRLEEDKAKVEALLQTKKKTEDKKSTQTKDTVDTSKAMATAGKRRDPFVNPITRVAANSPDKPPCTKTGPTCMSPDQIVLKGVIKTPAGMIAMIENVTKKEYNLREKDLILDGFVYKITNDSIIFRVSVMDILGKPTNQDVVKRVTASAR